MGEKQPHGRARSVPMVSLLTPDQLYRAIAGYFVSDFPLVMWARELGDLHAELIPLRFDGAVRRHGFDSELVRTEIRHVVAAIDVWTAHNVPDPHGARMHTHSLGEVVSHNAEVYVEAWWTVLHSADAQVRHAAWFRLGQAREGYVDMVDETQQRRLRYPAGAV